jgi:hypothetical protein
MINAMADHPDNTVSGDNDGNPVTIRRPDAPLTEELLELLRSGRPEGPDPVSGLATAHCKVSRSKDTLGIHTLEETCGVCGRRLPPLKRAR